jgi:hypothetical protein
VEVIAFYLPQFHPIAENDEWWGAGFTEWRSVVQGRPLFRGHWQPHLPADLGFVDLRCREALHAQARLALSYGVTGFAVYHYWFHGRRLLQRPLEALLEDLEWPGRFCICWANESWSRVWDGREHEVLIRQDYSAADDAQHALYLARVMSDTRYIRLDGRPLFLLYRPAAHPDLPRFTHLLREAVSRSLGKDPLVFGVRTGFDGTRTPAWRAMVDGVVGFQPNRLDFVLADRSSWLKDRVQGVLPGHIYQWLKRRATTAKRVDYAGMTQGIADAWDIEAGTALEYPCVFPNWDNTPRRATPIVIQSAGPEEFGRFVANGIAYLRRSGRVSGPLFVNAWNEWAEGCHLEPDLRHGRGFLEQLAGGIRGAATNQHTQP